MNNELLRRLSILNKKKTPEINARMMRGGMQERLRRQEAIRFNNKIKNDKKKLKSLIEKEKQKESQSFDIQSFEQLGIFEEPILKKIRNSRGYY
jgi:hypothetical protein